MPGLSIAIEGLDGTGKSTLARELARALGAELLSTPGSQLGDVQGQLEAAYSRSPVALQLFYASSVAAAASRVAEFVTTGRHVVVDRFWLSTVVNAPLRGESIDLPQVERWLRPVDVTFVLEVADLIREERLRARGMNDHDRQTLNPATSTVLRAAYRRGLMRPVSGRGFVLDGTTCTPDELVGQALEAVDRVAQERLDPTGLGWNPGIVGRAILC